MSVFIDGMNMPTRCFECPCIDTEDGLYCGIAGKDLRKEHGINICRPGWCPLIDVPITADELHEIIKYMMTPNVYVSKYNSIYHFIEQGKHSDK